MKNKFKIYLRFTFYLIITLSLLLTSCSKDNNPVTPKEYITPRPFDPDAPKIDPLWESWIKIHSKEIKSLTSTDYSDLHFLDTLLQNKKIVQLGESAHGVSEFSAVKVRLIKYLHEQLGFNVVAFESSVFDCYYANANKAKLGPDGMMQNSIFSVWDTYEVEQLFKYIYNIRNTSSPLILAGIDIQPSSYGSQYRPEFLKNVFNKISKESANGIFQLDTYFQSIDSNTLYNVKDSLVTEYQSYLDLLENNWDKVIKSYPENSPVPDIAKLSIRSNIKYINQRYYEIIGNSIKEDEERDSNMAYNLEYLHKNVYPNEKIIVWAHNYHIRYNSAVVKNTFIPGANTMGYYLHKDLADELYTVGLFTYKGQVALNNRTAVDVTKETGENIEAILYYSGYFYAFVDMLNQTETAGNSWMFKQMKAKYWGMQDQLLVPKEQFDAILYIYESHLPGYLNLQPFKTKSVEFQNPNYYQ